MDWDNQLLFDDERIKQSLECAELLYDLPRRLLLRIVWPVSLRVVPIGTVLEQRSEFVHELRRGKVPGRDGAVILHPLSRGL